MRQPPANHLEALEKANRVRLERAAMKRMIKLGWVSMGEALEQECLQTATLFELLRAQRRWGREKALRFITSHRIGELTRVENLTERQRCAVRDKLK